MKIYPAIDLRGGRVVRLTQGDYDRMQVYGENPLDTALAFRAVGAERLHVVDLDGARTGAPRNQDALAVLAAQSGLFVQTGGGIRTATRVRQVLELGVGRAILGTAALEDEALLRAMIAEYGERIAVGVDARNGKVATGGWLNTSDTDAMAFCTRLRDLGVRTVIYTDIDRDGRLAGTNLAAYRALSALEGLDIIASGGITTLTEIKALREMGLHGAIVGKALYEGRLDLKAALAAAKEEGQ